MAVTIKDISEKLNLHRSTVCRALNNKNVLNARGVPYISAETEARVRKASREMGYRPNRLARSLRLGKSMQIAFWVPDMKGRAFQEFFYKLHEYLRTFEYETILCEFEEHMLSETNSRSVARSDVDGVTIYGGELGEAEDDWKGFSTQFAIVNMGIVPYKGTLDYLHIDAYPAVVEAMEHLLKTNRSKIVNAIWYDLKWEGDPRYSAYINTLEKAGKTPEFLEISPGLPHKQAARKSACEYIKTNGCPDAFFCGEDEIAIGVYKGIKDMGLEVPKDVAIVGFNGIQETEYFDPSISTITHPIEEMCAQAWNMLSKRMEKEDLPRQKHTLKAKFLSRGSSQRAN